jgi:type II secretory pathway component PulF
MAESGPKGRVLFRYRAVEAASGRIRTGEQDGESAYAVRASLRRIGLDVLHLADVTPGKGGAPAWLEPFLAARDARRRRLHRVAKADLCDGLATLILAGIPIEQAVASLADTSARPAAEQRLLRALRDRLREGVPFATACGDHLAWFDQFDVALLDAGQRAGELAATLQNLAQHHHRAGAFGQKIFVALAYPAVLVAAGLAALVFMSFQTLPQLVTMIEQGRQHPPALTTAVIALGQGLATWWPVVVAALIALVVGARRALVRVPATSRLGNWLHGNPLARMLGRIRVAHLAAALARLRRAGTPLADALLIVADTVSDRALRALIQQAVEAIRRGEDLSGVFSNSRLLDPEFSQLLHLGERSGELTEMLERIAERYQRSADRASDRLAAILGPAAIVVLAALIGTLVMAAVLPLMQLGDLV